MLLSFYTRLNQFGFGWVLEIPNDASGSETLSIINNSLVQHLSDQKVVIPPARTDNAAERLGWYPLNFKVKSGNLQFSIECGGLVNDDWWIKKHLIRVGKRLEEHGCQHPTLAIGLSLIPLCSIVSSLVFLPSAS